MKMQTKQQTTLGLVTKKGLTLFLIFAFFLAYTPTDVFAQSGATTGNQAATYNNTTNKQGGQPVAAAAGHLGSCVASNILTNGVSSAVTSAITSLVGSKTEQATAALTKVSVSDAIHQDKTEVLKQAQAGFTIPYTNILIGTSWDSVAWCVVNGLIEYIADSTIEWANRGFNGNPAFIDNMGNFLTDIADQEASNFIRGLASGIGNGGFDICSPFKVQIATGLSSGYSNTSSGNNFRSSSACTLNKITANLQGFTDGDFSEGGWPAWFSMTQNPQNNAIGMTITAQDELSRRISIRNNTLKLDLGLNRGFLNFKKCDVPGDERTCHTVTPGIVIQTELEKTLGIPKDRLVLAQKFDQVVSAIIDNLIKVALNKVLTNE
jgi:hypothetical protein